ncbi:hypothetical protein GCM10027084_23360 [Pseudoxanthomonas sangjuensis]
MQRITIHAAIALEIRGNALHEAARIALRNRVLHRFDLLPQARFRRRPAAGGQDGHRHRQQRRRDAPGQRA